MEFNEKVFLLVRIWDCKTVWEGVRVKRIYFTFSIEYKDCMVWGGGFGVKEYIYVLAEYTGGCPRKIRLKIKMHLHC